MLHKLLTEVDKSNVVVIASLIDWKEAFPRQCPKLGVEAFINIGVKPTSFKAEECKLSGMASFLKSRS